MARQTAETKAEMARQTAKIDAKIDQQNAEQAKQNAEIKEMLLKLLLPGEPQKEEDF